MQKMLNLKVNKIYNPLNKIDIQKKSSKNFKNLFYKKKDLKIINIGRLTDQKDQVTILKAINKLKKKINIRLIIIGRGNKKINLLNYIKKIILNGIIQIKNPNKNVFSYLKSADLFILSSKYEGLPNVLLEATI